MGRVRPSWTRVWFKVHAGWVQPQRGICRVDAGRSGPPKSSGPPRPTSTASGVRLAGGEAARGEPARGEPARSSGRAASRRGRAGRGAGAGPGASTERVAPASSGQREERRPEAQPAEPSGRSTGEPSSGAAAAARAERRPSSTAQRRAWRLAAWRSASHGQHARVGKKKGRGGGRPGAPAGQCGPPGATKGGAGRRQSREPAVAVARLAELVERRQRVGGRR